MSQELNRKEKSFNDLLGWFFGEPRIPCDTCRTGVATHDHTIGGKRGDAITLKLCDYCKDYEVNKTKARRKN